MLFLSRFVLCTEGYEEGTIVERDAELVRKARAGDSRAFTEIVDAYHRYLFAAVLPIVGDPDSAQDVLQDAFLQIHRFLSSYHGPSLKSWMARIAVNKAIDWRRATARNVSIKDAIVKDSSKEVAGPSSEDEFLALNGYSDLASAVSRLPPAYKRVFLRRYAEGCDCKTIAASEGVSLRTVESRLYRARRMLKEVLTQG